MYGLKARRYFETIKGCLAIVWGLKEHMHNDMDSRIMFVVFPLLGLTDVRIQLLLSLCNSNRSLNHIYMYTTTHWGESTTMAFPITQR